MDDVESSEDEEEDDEKVWIKFLFGMEVLLYGICWFYNTEGILW